MKWLLALLCVLGLSGIATADQDFTPLEFEQEYTPIAVAEVAEQEFTPFDMDEPAVAPAPAVKESKPVQKGGLDNLPDPLDGSDLPDDLFGGQKDPRSKENGGSGRGSSGGDNTAYQPQGQCYPNGNCQQYGNCYGGQCQQQGQFYCNGKKCYMWDGYGWQRVRR